MGFVTLLQGNRRHAGRRRTNKSTKLGNNRKIRRRRFSRRNNIYGPGRLSVNIARRVRTLKALIPNGDSMVLERLFIETADYITCLEMRLRMMQKVVDALTGCSDL